ncbi:MAG: hypothetical protein IPG96_19365 [Proteobacteria bacterium]|nr:hypothetical protein [Pseudomonadota bacterium]
MSRTWSSGPRLVFATRALVAALLTAAAWPSVAGAQTPPGSSLPNPSVALRIGQADGARSGADFDEFRGDSSEAPVHLVGSNDLMTVRSWVGHSTCCTPGRSKYQTFTFRGLDPSLVYAFYLPSYLRKSS